MKKILILCLMIFTIVSCKNKNKISESIPEGELEVLVLCSGKEYFTNDKFFRSSGLGESLDQSSSKKKALSNARSEMAISINVLIKGVVDNYVNSREFNNREEVSERFESLMREIVNQKLIGTKIICERVVKIQSGNIQGMPLTYYKTYVAIELGSNELISLYNQRLSKDERTRIDYDYEQFKETFDKEMQKLSK